MNEMQFPIETIEGLSLKKKELQGHIQKQQVQVEAIWKQLVTPEKPSTKGELVVQLINHGVTAFDTFMLFRKIFLRYGSLLHLGKGSKGSRR